MNKCLKVKIKQKKVWILVLGCPCEELLSNQSLVYEILKTIGHQMGIDYLKELEDFSDVQIESEHPDFVVKVCNGKIDVVDFI